MTTARKPKQTPNPLPDPEKCPRYYAAPSKGSAPDAQPRIVVVDAVTDDPVHNDKRIFYRNGVTGRRGSTLYETFKSGAEFWPVVEDAPEEPVVPPVVEPPQASAPSATGAQLPLLVSVQPVQLERLVAIGEQLTAIGERIAKALETLVGATVLSPVRHTAANDKAA